MTSAGACLPSASRHRVGSCTRCARPRQPCYAACSFARARGAACCALGANAPTALALTWRCRSRCPPRTSQSTVTPLWFAWTADSMSCCRTPRRSFMTPPRMPLSATLNATLRRWAYRRIARPQPELRSIPRTSGTHCDTPLGATAQSFEGAPLLQGARRNSSTAPRGCAHLNVVSTRCARSGSLQRTAATVGGRRMRHAALRRAVAALLTTWTRANRSVNAP